MLTKRNKSNFLRVGIILLILLQYGYRCPAQNRALTMDINHDGKEDTVVHIAATNAFTIKYIAGAKRIEKQVLFFNGFGKGIANMSYGTNKGLLWFSIRFAPKYLDQDTLWFSYDKKKADWALLKMTTYQFNTIDPRLISQTCSFALKPKIWLLKDQYEYVQTLAEQKKNRLGEKCIQKQEH